MNGMVGINVEIERNWTWVSGKTYPVKEELKAQGFYWSTKRRAWYNRRIVDVKINNNGNGHKDTFVKEKTTAKNTTVMVKAKVKEQELSEHDKALMEGNYKIEGKLPSEEKEVEPEATDKESLTVQKEEVKEYQSIGQIDSTILKEVAGFLSNIEPSIYPLHVNRQGWNIDFIDLGNTIAGNVEITKEAWFGYWDTNDMELTFDPNRVKNMFSTMKKGDMDAEIGFDEYNMIANWGTLTWTHKLRDVEQIVKPPHVKDFDYPVKLTIGKLTISDIKKKLKEVKKELEKYDNWAGVILKYKEEPILPPSLKDQFGIYTYRFSWDNEGKKYIPTLKPIIELSSVMFDLDTDKREPTIGIYTFDNFEKLLKGIKSDVTLSFGDSIPLKAEFEIRQGVKVVAWQASDSVQDEEKQKLMSCNIGTDEKVDEIARTEDTRVFIPNAKGKTVIPKKEISLTDLVAKIVEYSEDVLAQVEPIGLLNSLNLVERTKRISYNAEGKILKQELISEKDPDIQKISEIVSKSNELHEIENKAYKEWRKHTEERA